MNAVRYSQYSTMYPSVHAIARPLTLLDSRASVVPTPKLRVYRGQLRRMQFGKRGVGQDPGGRARKCEHATIMSLVVHDRAQAGVLTRSMAKITVYVWVSRVRIFYSVIRQCPSLTASCWVCLSMPKRKLGHRKLVSALLYAFKLGYLILVIVSTQATSRTG